MYLERDLLQVFGFQIYFRKDARRLCSDERFGDAPGSAGAGAIHPNAGAPSSCQHKKNKPDAARTEGEKMFLTRGFTED